MWDLVSFAFGTVIFGACHLVEHVRVQWFKVRFRCDAVTRSLTRVEAKRVIG